MKAGDRVILYSVGGEGSKTTPYQGTEFACGGRILSIFIGSYGGEEMAQIIWDNGCAATIYSKRLKSKGKELNQTNPNSAFLLEKRRRK